MTNSNNSVVFPDWSWDDVNSKIDPSWSTQIQHAAWTDACKEWLRLLHSSLCDHYGTLEGQSFLLFARESFKESGGLIRFLDAISVDVSVLLKGVNFRSLPGKRLAMVFGSRDVFAAYLGNYFGTDTAIADIDCTYVGEGYEHIVSFEVDVEDLKGRFAYYFVMLAFDRMNLPIWVLEGVARCLCKRWVEVERQGPDYGMFERQASFWRQVAIDRYWSGQSFYSDPFEVSITAELSEYLTSVLWRDRDRFVSFLNCAEFNDGGESALRTIYQVSQRDLSAPLL